jgi:dynein light chain LC8-type
MAAAADPAALALAAAMAALPKPAVVSADMPADICQKCFDLTAEALVTHKVEKDQAMHVKRALEAWNGSLWHVIIGTSFGASVAHEVHAFLLFRVGKTHVLCFQSFDDMSLVQTEKKAVPRAVAKKEEESEEPGGGDA